MKLNLNAKIDKINTLKGKEEFNVSDLIKLLSKLDESAKIRFGVRIKENVTGFFQDDNFIFRLTYDNIEDEDEGNYVIEILTNAIGELELIKQQ